MAFDNSRNSFNHWNGYSGVVMEQGRVQTDSDWNEWLAEQSRRSRAGTLDILGHAVCPQTTPNGFKIDATSSGDLRIGLGRMYVDGILVENFGEQTASTAWDPALAELSNVPQPQPTTPQVLDASNSILFDQQPFNNGASVPTGPGQYLAYLDVWQRPITYIEDANLIDPAIGIDTTGRLQTAWRVNLIPMPAVVVEGKITSSSGSFNPGDLVTQANTNATALVIGSVPSSGPMILSIVSGSADGSSVWNDTSGAQFTPSAAPSGSITVIQGAVSSSSAAFQAGENVVQQGTGASATLEGAVPTATQPMTVGRISGTPAPFANWIGQTSGAIFQPTSVPSSSISTIQGAVSSSASFIANEQVIQQSTGASAYLIGTVPQSGPMTVGAITGSPDGTGDWEGQSSSASFTPSALPMVSGWSCSSSDYSIPWPASSGTLTTGPTTSPKSGPCCLSTGSGYTGPENQFYRIEIHTPGAAGGVGATFKWSRENASVQTAVTAISSATNSLLQATNALTVQSLGRDQVLGFNAGDWIEITDQSHDNACLPGELYKIDSVNVPNSSITLVTPLSSNFSSTTIDNNKYTRIIRWDQRGEIQNIESSKQTNYYNLDGTGSAPTGQLNGFTGIPIPTDGSPVVLEDGIAITFGLSLANGSYQAMDYWNFTARTADGTIQVLTNQPPAGVAHHYTKLATVSIGVSSTPSATDCRTLWPPTTSGSGDCGCCCSVTVSPDANSNAKFTSIQKAIDSLHLGGEVCLEPGNYYENVIIPGLRNITIKGCGARTRVYSQSLQPGGNALAAESGGYTISGFDAVFTIVASQNITIESLAIVAAETELGVLMDQSSGKGWNLQGTDTGFKLPDSQILLTDLEIAASKRPAIGARYVTNLTICDNRIQMRNVASLYPAVYLEGDAIRFERNQVKVESVLQIGSGLELIVMYPSASRNVTNDASLKQSSKSSALTGALAAASGGASVDAIGGVQIGGPSIDVWIVENEIQGSTRNGITLGNIIYLDNNGNRDYNWVGVLAENESTCAGGGSGTIPGSYKSGSTTVSVAVGGRIRNLHILRNRIRDIGMCGIGPVGFFDITQTREIVSLENVLIAENILVNTLNRNVLAAAVSASPYGYGAISLPDVVNLLIRSNIIVNYGITPGAEVCGIYVYHGECIEIDSNEIRETRDLSSSTAEKYVNYGGKRAGIYIESVTPPTLDTSADSPWSVASSNEFNVDASDKFRIELPNYAPGFPALRIENNTVRVAFGLALRVEGTGPFSILGNHFATGGTVAADSLVGAGQFNADSLAALASNFGDGTSVLTAYVLNLGFSLEAYDEIEYYGDLVNAAQTSAGNSTLTEAAGALSTLAAASGTVLFSNNICQLITQLNSVRGLCSVALFTLDGLLFNSNQLWINGQRLSALVDALLFGVTVQAISNRLEESVLSVALSGLSVGWASVNAQNISSFKFTSIPATGSYGVSAGNIVIFP